jgi:hypothetical protein
MNENGFVRCEINTRRSGDNDAACNDVDCRLSTLAYVRDKRETS